MSYVTPTSGTRVKLLKVSEKHRSPHLRVGFWVEAVLLRDLRVGDRIEAFRLSRPRRYPTEDGRVVSDGVFTSSVIGSIKGSCIETFNSTWRVTRMKPFSVKAQMEVNQRIEAVGFRR